VFLIAAINRDQCVRAVEQPRV